VTGIYFLWFGNEIVYVGQSRNITQRVFQHVQDGTKRFDGLSFLPVKPSLLNKFERRYIERLLPRYNQCGIARAARLLRSHGHAGPLSLPSGTLNDYEAADYLGITVESLIALNLVEARRVRKPRSNVRRQVRRYAANDLLAWSEANADLLRSLQAG
jgi:hypothetical protein